MSQLKVDLKSILDVPGSSVDVHDEITIAELTVGDESFVATGPTRVRVTVTYTGAEVVAYGSASLPATTSCVRCLCDFPLMIEADVSGFYVIRGREESIPDEQEFEYIGSDETIDLMPAIMQALVLEAPFAPVHSEDCKGLCPTCGTDLNIDSCTCDSGVDESSPFAALKDLVTDQDDE